ncbi:MAG: 2,3-bisphosphoglycerate-independent phosphoglycerate mutase [Phycisphaerales bacterium]|nr:2,3-bisphosphoglycerate-independent phosphoglycerate mutase [Planctomycetota bacterium]
MNRSPLVLIIRDGWGTNPHPQHDSFNAVHLARTPVADRLMRNYPWTLIKTSGEDVGLPEGTMGNSEVGHQNIGAGRVVPQESLVMTKACKGGLHTNKAIAAAVTHAKQKNSNLHLLGINSDAGVHGLLEHLYAILAAAKQLGLDGSRVFLHLFTDGRDTGPFTGLEFAKAVEARCAELGVGRIASVMGRYYAMDRDHRWERVQLAFDCLIGRGESATAPSARSAIQHYYDNPSGETLKGDEFVTPTAIGTAEQVRASRVKDHDSVIFFNYRGDRPREISAAFVFPDDKWAKVKPSPDTGRNGFDRGRKLDLFYVTMTDYWEALTPFVSEVAFPKPPRMVNIAGEWISKQAANGGSMHQFRCAETEKYPHVTFFFNDYREEPFPGETRENPPSPKVKTYDMKPEMSAEEICDAVLSRLAAPDCEEFIVVNFANADMVGHTGSLPAAIRACETVDACVGKLVDAVLKRGGSLIVTADHGNSEQMFDPETNAPHTAHTVYDVPLIVVGEKFKGRRLRGDQDPAGWFRPATRAERGRLADILPTALEMMGIPQPAEMTGQSLLLKV